MSDWTFERLTAAGRSAVAVYACESLRADSRAQLAALGCPMPGESFGRARLIAFGRDPAEDCVFVEHAPESVEIHTHGGPAAQMRVEALLLEAGGRRQSVISFERECWDAVAACTTFRLAERLATLADGQLKAELNTIRELAPREQRSRLAELIACSSKALRMLSSPTVAILGLPNAGKSSLMNQLAGYERSLVDPRPGATRDAVTLETAINGFPVTFVDTAGIRESQDPIEVEGVKRSLRTANAAALQIIVVDQSAVWTHDGDPWQPASAGVRGECDPDRPFVVVRHKTDLPDVSGLRWPSEAIGVSSKTSDGLDDLMSAVDRLLAGSRPGPDDIFVLNKRQLDVVEQLEAGGSSPALWSTLLEPASRPHGE